MQNRNGEADAEYEKKRQRKLDTVGIKGQSTRKVKYSGYDKEDENFVFGYYEDGEDAPERGCQLHWVRNTFDKSYYDRAYIFSETSGLFYLLDGQVESVKINDMEKFKSMFKEIMDTKEFKYRTKHLNKDEIYKFITLNTGHAPIRDNKINSHIIQNTTNSDLRPNVELIAASSYDDEHDSYYDIDNEEGLSSVKSKEKNKSEMSLSCTASEIIKFSYHEHADLHYKKAEIYFQKGKYFSAIKKIKRAIEKIEKHKKKYNEKYENVISYEFKDDTVMVFNSAIAIDERADDDYRNLISYRIFLGGIFYEQEKYSLAIKEYQHVTRLFPKINEINDDDHRYLYLCHHNSQVIYSRQYNYSDAIEHGKLAIAEYEKIQHKMENDRRILAVCRNKLAADYYDNGNNNLAIELLESAIGESNNSDVKNLKNRRELANCRELSLYYKNISVIYSSQDDDDAVIENLEHAIELLEKIDLHEVTYEDWEKIHEYRKIIGEAYDKRNTKNVEKINQLENQIQIMKSNKLNENDKDEDLEKKQKKSALLSNSILNKERNTKTMDNLFQKRKIERRASF